MSTCGAVAARFFPCHAHSPLQLAVRQLDVPKVQALLATGADPRIGKPTPMEIILRKYNSSPEDAIAIITSLTTHGALDFTFTVDAFPPRQAVLSDKTPGALGAMFHGAHESGRICALREAINDHGLPKFVCETGRESALRMLLDEGWDAHTPDEHGVTLIHCAVNAPQLAEAVVWRIVNLLIQHGDADLDLRDSFGRNVFQIARQRGFRTVCSLLRDYGADEEPYRAVLLRGV